MSAEELKVLLRKGEGEKISLHSMKTYQILIDFLADEDSIVRRNATKLLFKGKLVPVEEILKKYLKDPNPLVKDVIISKLYFFIPIISKYLIRNESFELLADILSEQSAKKISASITRAYTTTPVLAALTELSIRTCHVSFSDFKDSFIDFHFISEQSKDIKKILLYRLNQSVPLYTELTLFTITLYPELAYLVVKQIRELFTKSKEEEPIRYAALALMHIDEPKNADVLIQRLSTFKDSTDTQLSIIESLGNLGNPKATDILIEQFEKGEPEAYYAAKSLAMIGDVALPKLIIALEDDRNVPYIIESMKRIGDTSYDFLMDALQKGKKKVRKNAAQCLTLVMSQKYGYEGAIRLLTTQLAGKNPSIIEAVTQALLTLGTPSIRVLVEELQDDDLQLRKNAIEVLHYFGYENIELALDGLLDVDVNLVVRLGLILYLYYPEIEMQELGKTFALSKKGLRVKDDEIMALLSKSVKEMDPAIREKSCDMLFHCGSKSIPILSLILSDPNINVRRKAVESLRKIKNKRALITLIRAAKDSDDVIAEISIRALGELQDPGVIDVIIENMKRSKKLVREAAVYAAVKIGPPITKKLSQQLSSVNQHLANSTISALSQMDTKILKTILPELKTADIRWFNNLKQVVEKMGKSASPIIKSFYDKTKLTKTKDRLFILLSHAKDSSIVPDIIERISKGNHRLGLTALNNLGKDSVKPLVKELTKLPTKARDTFIEKTRNLKPEIVTDLLDSIYENKKLEKFANKLFRVHSRTIRRFCAEADINYDNYVKKFQNK